jgi:hypothetical protein
LDPLETRLTRFHPIPTASDAMLTRTLTHCLRALLTDPATNIQLLVNLCDAANEIQRRDLDPQYVAGRIAELAAAWDGHGDVL